MVKIILHSFPVLLLAITTQALPVNQIHQLDITSNQRQGIHDLPSSLDRSATAELNEPFSRRGGNPYVQKSIPTSSPPKAPVTQIKDNLKLAGGNAFQKGKKTYQKEVKGKGPLELLSRGKNLVRQGASKLKTTIRPGQVGSNDKSQQSSSSSSRHNTDSETAPSGWPAGAEKDAPYTRRAELPPKTIPTSSPPTSTFLTTRGSTVFTMKTKGKGEPSLEDYIDASDIRWKSEKQPKVFKLNSKDPNVTTKHKDKLKNSTEKAQKQPKEGETSTAHSA